MRCLILSQSRDLKIGVIGENLGALTRVQKSAESVEGDLFDIGEDCSRESYSSQVWSGQ